MQHIVALSGGKDSTAMRLWLAENEPRDYTDLITPTGDELPEMFAHWKYLETLFGNPLTVIMESSLGGLIRQQNALPNWRQRWCTRLLKIEPFNKYLLEHRPAVVYVGLRADEPENVRKGNTIFGNVDGITQRFPLRELGWGINDVYQYLESKGITIPDRTDCARCFFQTLAEWWWLWKDNLEIWMDAEAQEEAIGHTFRSPGRDTWPAALVDLRREFEKGRIPRGAGQVDLMGRRGNMCRVCSL